ncbi:hypothetical protein ACFLRA_03160, partial [Bdellovibrionota bacterium]
FGLVGLLVGTTSCLGLDEDGAGSGGAPVTPAEPACSITQADDYTIGGPLTWDGAADVETMTLGSGSFYALIGDAGTTNTFEIEVGLPMGFIPLVTPLPYYTSLTAVSLGSVLPGEFAAEANDLNPPNPSSVEASTGSTAHVWIKMCPTNLVQLTVDVDMEDSSGQTYHVTFTGAVAAP